MTYVAAALAGAVIMFAGIVIGFAMGVRMPPPKEDE